MNSHGHFPPVGGPRFNRELADKLAIASEKIAKWLVRNTQKAFAKAR